MKACLSCQWFREVNKDGGTCHLEPAKVFMLPVESVRGTAMQAAGIWPPVRNTDGCSKHAERLH